jgi:hypothetical protein
MGANFFTIPSYLWADGFGFQNLKFGLDMHMSDQCIRSYFLEIRACLLGRWKGKIKCWFTNFSGVNIFYLTTVFTSLAASVPSVSGTPLPPPPPCINQLPLPPEGPL